MLQNLSNTSKTKLELCYFATFNHPIEIKDPIYSLISSFIEIQKISSIYDSDTSKSIKFFYFNKNKIHSILYDQEEIIKINNLNGNNRLEEYFYLSLLIKDDLTLINYSYSLNYINNIISYQKGIKSLLKIIIISKIIIDLVNNYKLSDFYDDDNIEERDKIEKIELEYKTIIKNNIETLKIIDIFSDKNFYTIKIDQMYVNIIISLIKNNKFEDFEYIQNITHQLELESINITKNMYEELLMVFNKNYINEYMIKCLDDLFDNKKINFNYFFLKYVFRDPFYIYNIPFFFVEKKAFIKIIKSELIIFKAEEIVKERIEYLLKVIPDSEYYYIKYLKVPQIQLLNEIYEYYNEFLFETKKEEIKEIEPFLQKKENNINTEKYFKDYEIAKKLNIRKPIIKYIYNLNIKNEQKNEKSEEKIQASIQEWLNIEKMIKDKKIKKLRKNLKVSLINYFNDINNKAKLLQILKEDEYQFFIQGNKKYGEQKNISMLKKDKQNNNNSNEIGSSIKKLSTRKSGKLFQLKLIFIIYR